MWHVFRLPGRCPEIEALLEEHKLLTRVVRQQTGPDETSAIGELGEAIGRCNACTEIPALLAIPSHPEGPDGASYQPENGPPHNRRPRRTCWAEPRMGDSSSEA